MRPAFQVLVIVAIAVVVTLGTGEAQSITLPLDPSGFPLQWITPIVYVCPPITGAPRCPPPSPAYDWLSFVLDVLFYAAVGLSLLLVYSYYHAKTRELDAGSD